MRPGGVVPSHQLGDLEHEPTELLFLFVEVVATDGPIHEDRRAAPLKLITDAGFKSEQAAFLTAFQSRDQGVSRRPMR